MNLWHEVRLTLLVNLNLESGPDLDQGVASWPAGLVGRMLLRYLRMSLGLTIIRPASACRRLDYQSCTGMHNLIMTSNFIHD